jgi:hypothetical protein
VLDGTWPAGVTVSYAWSGAAAVTDAAVYAPVEEDVDRSLSVTVTASKAGHTSWVGMLRTAKVAAAPIPPTPATPFVVPVVSPALSTLAPVAGSPLELVPGSWNTDDVTVSFTWTVAGADPGDASTYTPTAADVGKSVSVLVTASKAGFETWSGQLSTAKVKAAPEPAKSSSPAPAPSTSQVPTPQPSTSSPSDTKVTDRDIIEFPAPPVVVTKVKVPQASVRLAVGQKVTLAGAAYTSTGGTAKVTWKSSNTKVAKVVKGKITAKKAGTAIVRVTAGGKTAKIKVRVVARANADRKAPAKVSASGIAKTMKVGAVAWATGKYSPASAQRAKVAFTSSRPAVVSVDKAGRLVAKAAGKAVITVKAGSKAKKYTVKVA